MQKKLKLQPAALLSRQAHIPYVGPIALWIVFFVVVPLIIILYFSFLQTGLLGQIVHSFTFKNYINAFRGEHGLILLYSFAFALVANLACLLLGYPLAYWITTRSNRWKSLLLFLIVIPSWTNYLIRLYGLRTLLSHTGIVSRVLQSLSLISSPLDVLYTPTAVMIGLVYTWLPYMVLPIYASLDGLDPSLLEAADDLGASPIRKFLTVTLPLTKGGVFAGTILVFIPALGDWLVPFILGGAKVMMAGSLVEHYFISVGNIPAGSSIATLISALVLFVVWISLRLGGREVLERIT
ncbi:MAG: ABC transporter permease [Firmicutes bacterium]|nr:ABC transporter permease [Bacillota bacterium]